MSVNSKLTAIADDIRSLRGLSGKMGLDAMASNLGEAVNECDTQASLIHEIETALIGKAAGSGGVQLPKLENQGTAGDLAMGKQLISAIGSVVTGTVETHTDYSQSCTPKEAAGQVLLEKTLNAPIMLKGNRVSLQTPLSNFGDAEPGDVRAGVTFTSKGGLKIYGEAILQDGDAGEELEKVEADSLSELHYWEKYSLASVTETKKTSQYISYQNPGSTDFNNLVWDTVKYADSYEITNGAIVLVNPQTMTVSHDSDNNVLLGKYIHTSYNDCFYYIPAEASIVDSKAQYGTGLYVTASTAILLVCNGSAETLEGIAVSSDRSAFPTNGELDGYTYVYQGALNDTEKAAVIQALTITENGTYTVPAGVDGYSPVTVNVDQGVQLPSIEEDVLGTASDLAEGKQLIGADGSVVTGNVPTPNGLLLEADMVEGDQTFYIEGSITENVLLRKGKFLNIHVDPSKVGYFGTATPADVRRGVTFTSASGYAQIGDLEVQTGGGVAVRIEGETLVFSDSGTAAIENETLIL